MNLPQSDVIALASMLLGAVVGIATIASLPRSAFRSALFLVLALVLAGGLVVILYRAELVRALAAMNSGAPVALAASHEFVDPADAAKAIRTLKRGDKRSAEEALLGKWVDWELQVGGVIGPRVEKGETVDLVTFGDNAEVGLRCEVPVGWDKADPTADKPRFPGDWGPFYRIRGKIKEVYDFGVLFLDEALVSMVQR